MDEPDLSELILQVLTAPDDKQADAYAGEFERRLVAGQGLFDDAVNLLVEAFGDAWLWHEGRDHGLLNVLRRQHALLSGTQKRRLNAALRLADESRVIFDAEEMEERLRQAAAAGDEGKKMRACAHEFEDLGFGWDGYPEGSVDVIVRLLGEAWFREAKGFSEVLWVLLTPWEFEKFSEGEKERLLPALELVFRESTNWWVIFLISESLGELYPDKRGFFALRRLMDAPRATPCSYVPHAWEHFLRAVEDPELEAWAEAALRSMENDPGDPARYEAAYSRAVLANRGRGGRVPRMKVVRPRKQSRTGHSVRRPGSR